MLPLKLNEKCVESISQFMQAYRIITIALITNFEKKVCNYKKKEPT